MATSSFKSTTKRTPIGSSSEDSGSNSGKSLRRSRSLSQFSRPLSPEETPEYIKNGPRGKFVNTDRGSATFSEISLDDLALELFSNESDWSADRERDRGEGSSEIRRWASDTASSSRRRGRSVSRSRGSDVKTVVSNGISSKNDNSSKDGSRRRRSLSVSRCQISDSENAPDHSRNSSNHASAKGPNGRNNLMNSSKKSNASSNRLPGKDLSLLHDDYSSNSFALANDESKDTYFGRNRFDKIMQALYAQKRSEKHKQNLLAEMLLEEQRRQDLSKIIRELLPDSKSAAITGKPSRSRKSSSDRSRMSKGLTEEAEKYFEDFISNVEDTDISSFDGDRSDGSSTLGRTTRAREVTIREEKSYLSPAGSSCPIEMEGVVLPWLQWETSHDCSLSEKDKMQAPDIQETLLLDSKKDMKLFQDSSSHSTGSYGSGIWRIFDCPISSRDESGGKSRLSRRPSYFDMEEYVKLQRNDELLFEMYKEQQRINAGSLLLCGSVL